MTVYPEDRLYEEMAYVAYHLHWSFDSLLDMEHATRTRFVDEVGRLNARAREEG